MGDPRKLRKKYQTPVHPWNKTEIDESKKFKSEFGIRNRKELLKAETFLKKYKDIAKRLTADKSAQGQKEKQQVLDKFQRYGLLPAGSELHNILNIDLSTVLERRFQSILVKLGHAKTMPQARQFVVQRHVFVGNKGITSPTKLLTLEEESQIRFKPTSKLADDNHPERVNEAEKIKEEREKILPKSKKEDKKAKSSNESKEESPVEKEESEKTNDNTELKKDDTKAENNPEEPKSEVLEKADDKPEVKEEETKEEKPEAPAENTKAEKTE